MKVTIEISTDNAAFEDHAGTELSRILRKLADKVDVWNGANEFKLGLLDINGNKVGTARVEK